MLVLSNSTVSYFENYSNYSTTCHSCLVLEGVGVGMEKPGVNGWHKIFSLTIFFDVIKANFVLEYVRTTLKWI